MSDPFTLIYIASPGRSGSTILELLLNTVERIWSMGEIYTLPWEIRRNGRCGCGKAVKECDFWSGVLSGNGCVPADAHEIARFRETFSGGKFFRPVQMMNILFRTGWLNGTAKEAFCRENHRLFKKIHEQAARIRSNIDHLVDASKDFYRLHWLLKCPRISLKVIHIVKDPRAYVYSTLKSDPAEGVAGVIRCLRMSIKYRIENAIIEHILGGVPVSDCFFVRYEDLAMEPEATLGKVSAWLGIPFDKDWVGEFRKIETHALAGNKTRHASSGILLDEAWKRNLSPARQRIVRAVTWKMGIRYGYYGGGG